MRQPAARKHLLQARIEPFEQGVAVEQGRQFPRRCEQLGSGLKRLGGSLLSWFFGAVGHTRLNPVACGDDLFCQFYLKNRPAAQV